jgi:hypothetical protein
VTEPVPSSLDGHFLAAALEVTDRGATPLHCIRKLEDPESGELSRALKCMLEFSNYQNLYLMHLLNYDHFKTTLDEYEADLEKYTGNYVSAGAVYANMARVILNCVNSFRIFVEYSENSVKRRYGEHSEEFRRFKAVLSHEYDTVFAYRFLYKLRNFIVHVGLPIDMWQRSHDLESREKRLKFALMRRTLLNDRKKFWGTILNDDTLPDELIVTDYVSEILRPSLERIRRAFHADCAERLRDKARQLAEVVNEAGAAMKGKQFFPVFLRVEGSAESTTFNFVPIPTQAIEAVMAIHAVMAIPAESFVADVQMAG